MWPLPHAPLPLPATQNAIALRTQHATALWPQSKQCDVHSGQSVDDCCGLLSLAVISTPCECVMADSLAPGGVPMVEAFAAHCHQRVCTWQEGRSSTKYYDILVCASQAATALRLRSRRVVGGLRGEVHCRAYCRSRFQDHGIDMDVNLRPGSCSMWHLSHFRSALMPCQCCGQRFCGEGQVVRRAPCLWVCSTLGGNQRQPGRLCADLTMLHSCSKHAGESDVDQGLIACW